MPGRNSVVPTLELISKSSPSRLFELDADSHTIGRDLHSDVRLPDGRVSTRHARIFRNHDGLYSIEDTDSRNFTYLDGTKLEKFTPHPLKDGCVIKICSFTLVYRLQAVEVHAGKTDEPTILGTLDDMSSLNFVSRASNTATVLKAVLEINRVLGGATELNEALGYALDELFQIFLQAECGFIITRDSNDKLNPRAMRHKDGKNEALKLSQTVLTHVMREGKGLIVSNAEVSEDLAVPDSFRSEIRTALCVPFFGRSGEPIGMIQLDSRVKKASFTPEDLDLLAAVAVPIGVVVENHQLLTGLAAVKAAAEVQRSLLPRRRPDSPAYMFWEFYQPALEVGGDYYDYIPVKTSESGVWLQWAVTLGDVSGKGMPAALLMANLCAEVRHLVRAGNTPGAVANGVNLHFSDAELPCHFITFLLAMIDTKTHTMMLVNAGHPCPLVRHADGTIEMLGESEAGMPLGVSRNETYKTSQHQLVPGDVFVLFTDGVTDAESPERKYFGEDGLRKILEATSGSPSAVGDAIIRAVRTHANGRSQNDDIALLCFGRT